jgi:mRNA interferase RelE/StbE
VKGTVYTATSVDRFLRKLDPQLADRIVGKMETLYDGPFSVGYKKLAGSSNAYRIRVGDYRILYEVDQRSKTIRIYTVEHRGRAYR